MAEKHLKKCTTSWIIRKYKLFSDFILAQFKMFTINKNKWQYMLVRLWGKGEHLFIVWVQTCTVTMKLWRFLKKLGINFPQDSGTPLLGIYTKDCTSYYRNTCSSMFSAALFIIARNGKQLDVHQQMNVK